jgi:hypothetical protein
MTGAQAVAACASFVFHGQTLLRRRQPGKPAPLTMLSKPEDWQPFSWFSQYPFYSPSGGQS